MQVNVNYDELKGLGQLTSDPLTEHDVKRMLNEQSQKQGDDESLWCLNLLLTRHTWKNDKDELWVTEVE